MPSRPSWRLVWLCGVKSGENSQLLERCRYGALVFGDSPPLEWGNLATVLDFFNIAKPMADQFL